MPEHTNESDSPDAADIADRFADLDDEARALLEDIQAEAGDRGAAGELVSDVTVYNWRTMPVDECVERWEALNEWVTWLIHRYELNSSRIPDCWYRHGAVVEELSTLYTFWLAAFQPDGSGGGPIGFHREMTGTFTRFKEDYNIGGVLREALRAHPAPVR